MVSMVYAPILVVLCHGMQQRTSSFVPAMVLNTTTKAKLLGVLHLWYDHQIDFFFSEKRKFMRDKISFVTVIGPGSCGCG